MPYLLSAVLCRKIWMRWIQIASINVRIMGYLKGNSFLLALISCTKWIQRSSTPGNVSPVFVFFFLGAVSHLTRCFLTGIRCNILKRVPNSALWLLRFPAAGEMRLRACMRNSFDLLAVIKIFSCVKLFMLLTLKRTTGK